MLSDNVQNKTVGLISKTTALDVQYNFFVHSFTHFLTATIKLSRSSSKEIGPLCFFFFIISCFSSFSVIQVNVDIKIEK